MYICNLILRFLLYVYVSYSTLCKHVYICTVPPLLTDPLQTLDPSSDDQGFHMVGVTSVGEKL